MGWYSTKLSGKILLDNTKSHIAARLVKERLPWEDSELLLKELAE